MMENQKKYINFNKENNSKDSKFEVTDHVGISKDKETVKDYLPIHFEDVFVIRKSRILCRQHIYQMIVMEKKLLELFVKKNYTKNSR